MHAESEDPNPRAGVEQGEIAHAPGLDGDAVAALADTDRALRPQEPAATLAVAELGGRSDQAERSWRPDQEACRCPKYRRGGSGCDQLGPPTAPVQDEPDRPIEGEPANPAAAAQPDPEEGDEQHPNEDAESCDDEDELLAALEEEITAAGDPPIALGAVRSILTRLAEAPPSPLVLERALGLLRKASGIRIETLRQEYAATSSATAQRPNTMGRKKRPRSGPRGAPSCGAVQPSRHAGRHPRRRAAGGAGAARDRGRGPGDRAHLPGRHQPCPRQAGEPADQGAVRQRQERHHRAHVAALP